jgi:cytochrome bd-type quinol oxidase subunit 2
MKLPKKKRATMPLKPLAKSVIVSIFVIILAVITGFISALVLWQATTDNNAAAWSNVVITIALVAMTAFFLALPLLLGLVGEKLAYFYILSFVSLLLIAICVISTVLDNQNPNNESVALAAKVTTGFAIAMSTVAIIYAPVSINRTLKMKKEGAS